MKKILAILLVSLFVIPAIFTMAVGVSADDLPFSRVLYAPKTGEAPNLEAIDETWGSPLIHVSDELPEAVLYNYWDPKKPNPNIGAGELATYLASGDYIYAEPSDFDFYATWDAKYLYLAFKSPDDEPCGASPAWCGDGMQMWIKHRNGVEDPYEHYDQGMYTMYWTLNVDDYTVQYGELAKDLEPFLEVEDGYLTAIVRIPFTDIGIRKSDVVDGLPLAMAIMRISSRDYRDKGYAGYLQWGFEYVITLVLDDPEVENQPLDTIPPKNAPPVYDTQPEATEPQESETTPAEIDPPAEADLSGVSSWALTEVEAAINEGLVPEYIQKDWTSPITRGQVSEMFIRLLEKATGKTVDAIIAEKGATIEEGKFEDTNDANVYAANALGIINGTSSSKFSPDGTLKRAQIAALINRVAKVVGIATEGYTHSFEDITDNYSWVNAELGWPSTVGIINGVSSTRFNPGGDLTTEQAILITYRALGALK